VGVPVAVPEKTIWHAWTLAAQTGEAAIPLNGLLDEIDRRAKVSGFACQQSGRCCRFESFGHKLYVSGLEIAWFRLLAGDPPARAGDSAVGLPVIDPKRDGCPYQVDGACSVHKHRPFACRVFFCQEGSDAWQTQRYEAFQLQIKRLHEELGLPYRYMEWRRGLADAAANGL
jgi:Fe-S-cluster containining protein